MTLLEVIAHGRRVNDIGELGSIEQFKTQAVRHRLRVKEIKTAPLEVRWQEKLPPGYLKSACSPMQAVLMARELIEANEIDVLILTGEEKASDWKGRKQERQRLMEIYRDGKSPFTEYNKVAAAFCSKFGLNKDDFYKNEELLFENYRKTWLARNPKGELPPERWFDLVSEFFRGVDCANPNVDFEGALVITSSSVSQRLGIPDEERFPIIGCSLKQLGEDGPENISGFITYDHVAECFTEASQQAQIDFKVEYLHGHALMEVYTCYPIPPQAFLLKNGFIDDLNFLEPFLAKHEITFTGGLNLNRAPWNCTTLNHIITGLERLSEDSSKRYLGVHGNSSLGHQQAFLIVTRF